MKRATLIASFAIGMLAMLACADGKTSSSNSGPEKSSLPSPGGNGNNGTASTGANVANSNNSNVATMQNNFYTSAARGGIAELEMSKLAQTKATNAEVKKFAQMMVADHDKANTELKSLAAAKSVALPAELSSSHASVLDELKGLAVRSSIEHTSTRWWKTMRPMCSFSKNRHRTPAIPKPGHLPRKHCQRCKSIWR